MSRGVVTSFGVSLLLLVTACRNTAQTPAGAEAELAEIDALQSDVFPDGLRKGTDSARAFPFVRAVEAFAKTYPTHERAAPLLMDAAGLANGTAWSNKAFQLWGQVWRKRPDFPRAAEAMFYQGFVADAKFGDYELAVQYYDRLIAAYPDSEYAAQAQQLRRVASGEQALPPVPDGPAEAPK